MKPEETTQAAQTLKNDMEDEARRELSPEELANYLYLRDVTLRWLSPTARGLFIKHLTQVHQLCASTLPDTSAESSSTT
jgi:hypothetical protein